MQSIEFTPAQERDIVRSYTVKRLSLADIAWEYDVSTTVIRAALSRNGVKLRRRGRQVGR